MEGYNLKKLVSSPVPLFILPYLLIIFAALGFLDASYLTISHYQHVIPPCTVGGCETVLTSNFATFFGIPIALLGVVFYAVILILSGLFLQTKKTTIASVLFVSCSLGFLVGIGLIFMQAYVLHAWCYYCLFSELIDFLLFDSTWWLWNGMKR